MDFRRFVGETPGLGQPRARGIVRRWVTATDTAMSELGLPRPSDYLDAA